MNNPNIEAYQSLGWILNYSEDGIYFIITSESMQQEIAAHYTISNVEIYDYKQHSGTYSFNVLEDWINSNLQADAYFILNFQLVLQDEKDINRLNFSRDMLANLQKNLLFCMTQTADNILARSAYDFYSYIKLRIFFHDETLTDNKEPEILLPRTFDKSVGIDNEILIDFNQSKPQLLSQAIFLINQAEQLSKDFRYCDALLLLQKALTIREQIFGEKHPDTATVYQHIADVYSDLHQHEKALEWYNETLEIREKVLGMEHPFTAATYNNIARVYNNQGEYMIALEWYQKALNIYEKVLGKIRPDTAATYNNIAQVYYNQGEYIKALEWNQKALLILEKVLGPEHPETAVTYNNIAAVYTNQGEYRKAMECYQKALFICEKVRGKDHPDTAATYHNIARVCTGQGEYGKALEWYQKALLIYEKVLGSEHPNTATTYNNIARVYARQGEYGIALEWYQKALDIFGTIFGQEHPYTRNVKKSMDYANHAGKQ